TWNKHALCTESSQRPEKLFMFGLMEQGAQGIRTWQVPSQVDEEAEDYATFGVDWEFLNTSIEQPASPLAPFDQ
ncbi:hypothetical protein DFP72DRAFT_829973, partial [Ephemerocybe angulata]